jgi:hypothetical protein
MIQNEAAFSPPVSTEIAAGCEEIVDDTFDRIGLDGSLARGVLEQGRRRIWREVCHEETTNDLSVYASMACLLDTGTRTIMPRSRRQQQVGLLLRMYMEVLPGEPTLVVHNASYDATRPHYWYGVSPEGGFGIQVSERYWDADPFITLGDQRVRPLYGIDPVYSDKLKGPARQQNTFVRSGATAIREYIADELIQPAHAALGPVKGAKEQKALHGRRAVAIRRLSALTSTLAAAGVEMGEYADEAELQYIKRKAKKYAGINFN